MNRKPKMHYDSHEMLDENPHPDPSRDERIYDFAAREYLNEFLSGELDSDDPEIFTYESSLSLVYWFTMSLLDDDFLSLYPTDYAVYEQLTNLTRDVYNSDPDKFITEVHSRTKHFTFLSVLDQLV